MVFLPPGRLFSQQICSTHESNIPLSTEIRQQLPIDNSFVSHEHVRVLRRISDIPDQIPEASALVCDDLIAHGPGFPTGCPSLTGDHALRNLVLKQKNGFSYVELAFHLADSRFYRAFCGLGIGEYSLRSWNLSEGSRRW